MRHPVKKVVRRLARRYAQQDRQRREARCASEGHLPMPGTAVIFRDTGELAIAMCRRCFRSYAAPVSADASRFLDDLGRLKPRSP